MQCAWSSGGWGDALEGGCRVNYDGMCECLQDVIAGAVEELGEHAFNVSVSAADLGCFWRAAGVGVVGVCVVWVCVCVWCGYVCGCVSVLSSLRQYFQHFLAGLGIVA